MPDLTPYQIAVLRACPDQPGARFPSSTKEVLALSWLAQIGLVRALPYYRRSGDGERVYSSCWQRTPAGKEVAK